MRCSDVFKIRYLSDPYQSADRWSGCSCGAIICGSRSGLSASMQGVEWPCRSLAPSFLEMNLLMLFARGFAQPRMQWKWQDNYGLGTAAHLHSRPPLCVGRCGGFPDWIWRAILLGYILNSATRVASTTCYTEKATEAWPCHEVFPLCGFSLSLFCNYNNEPYTEATKQPSNSTESCWHSRDHIKR